MTLTLRRFNEQGIKAFSEYLEALKANPAASPPYELLNNSNLSLPMEIPIQVTTREFKSRLDFAQWLDDAASRSSAEVPADDAGFWSWLSLALFDQVCPDKRGKRKVGERARYIPAFNDWKRRYRHLLANPYKIYALHKDDPKRSLVVLAGMLHTAGELSEQFSSRQELISCRGTMGLATLLFIDINTHTRKKGASGNAARRFGKILNQYMRTWDITVMQPLQAAKLLPGDFTKFVPESQTNQASATEL